MNIRDAINKHVKEIPWEGAKVDVDGIESLIKDLLKGFLTFSKQYESKEKGYFKDGKYHSRQDIVDAFINKLYWER